MVIVLLRGSNVLPSDVSTVDEMSLFGTKTIGHEVVKMYLAKKEQCMVADGKAWEPPLIVVQAWPSCTCSSLICV